MDVKDFMGLCSEDFESINIKLAYFYSANKKKIVLQTQQLSRIDDFLKFVLQKSKA